MIVYDYLLSGACFIGNRESGVRSPESGGNPRNIPARLQEALWRFQRCLGRLQEVLEVFLVGFEEILW